MGAYEVQHLGRNSNNPNPPGPANLQVTLPSPVLPGNVVLAFAAATGTGANIILPGNFTSLTSVNDTGIQCKLGMYTSINGGEQVFVATITGMSGGVVSFYEIDNTPTVTVPVVDIGHVPISVDQIVTGSDPSSTSCPDLPLLDTGLRNAFNLVFLAYEDATFSQADKTFYVRTTNRVSTNGTPNVRSQIFYCSSPFNIPTDPTLSGTWNTAVAYVYVKVRFHCYDEMPIFQGPYNEIHAVHHLSG